MIYDDPHRTSDREEIYNVFFSGPSTTSDSYVYDGYVTFDDDEPKRCPYCDGIIEE